MARSAYRAFRCSSYHGSCNLAQGCLCHLQKLTSLPLYSFVKDKRTGELMKQSASRSMCSGVMSGIQALHDSIFFEGRPQQAAEIWSLHRRMFCRVSSQDSHLRQPCPRRGQEPRSCPKGPRHRGIRWNHAVDLSWTLAKQAKLFCRDCRVDLRWYSLEGYEDLKGMA